MKFYDRQGQVITGTQWAKLHDDPKYIIVGQEPMITPDGEMFYVSTVWLGLNHNYLTDNPPLIFETMVFGDGWTGDCWRYSTEEQALAGHQQVIAETAAKTAATINEGNSS